jgi:Tol biopolymer transport system component
MLRGKIVFSSGMRLDFDIWRLDLVSGELRQLTHGKGINTHPRWSPDGRLIAYVATEDDNIPSLWVMNGDGSGKRRLTRDTFCQGPDWAPDGSHLIFAGNSADRSDVDLCRVDLKGSSIEVLYSRPGMELSPNYAPDGHHIIYSGVVSDPSGLVALENREIIEYNLLNRTSRVLASHVARDDGPLYSPDGTRIAFISHRKTSSSEQIRLSLQEYHEILRNGSNAEARDAMKAMMRNERDGDVWVMNRDGSGLTQLTDDAFYDSGVCWSPCGRFLMYSSSFVDDPETERLKVINAVTGDPVSFSYDRHRLEQELGTYQFLNVSPVQRLIPDFIERHLLPRAFWGEEQYPDWAA